MTLRSISALALVTRSRRLGTVARALRRRRRDRVTFTGVRLLSVFGTVESGTAVTPARRALHQRRRHRDHGAPAADGCPRRPIPSASPRRSTFPAGMEHQLRDDPTGGQRTAAVFTGTHAMTFAASPGVPASSSASIAIDVPASGFRDDASRRRSGCDERRRRHLRRGQLSGRAGRADVVPAPSRRRRPGQSRAACARS